jgi:hypothetical protein
MNLGSYYLGISSGNPSLGKKNANQLASVYRQVDVRPAVGLQSQNPQITFPIGVWQIALKSIFN